MYNQNSRDCVVLAFTGRELKVFCSLPDQTVKACIDIEPQTAGTIPVRPLALSSGPVEAVQYDGEDLQAAVETCITDINQSTEAINKALVDIKEMVREFTDIMRKYEG